VADCSRGDIQPLETQDRMFVRYVPDMATGPLLLPNPTHDFTDPTQTTLNLTIN